MTVNDLINGSLRLLGVLAEGENPSAQQQTDAFSALNDLIDSLSNESLLIWSKLREVFNLVAGQQTYAMGPQTISISTANSLTVGQSYQILSLGTTTTLQWQAIGDSAVTPAVGDVFVATAPSGTGTGTVQPTGVFNTQRPQLIENALIIPPFTTPTPELPMAILNKDEYAGIILKQIQSTIPLFIYNDDAIPNANINLWPVPQANTQIVLYSWKPIADFQSLTQVISLPPGYQRMLRFNLAIDLAAEYGIDPRATVVDGAIKSKAEIKRMNSKPLFLNIDTALAGRAKVFNWLTGEAQ